MGTGVWRRGNHGATKENVGGTTQKQHATAVPVQVEPVAYKGGVAEIDNTYAK